MKRRTDRDEIAERLRRVEETLDKVERSIEKIELVTVIREPNTGAAADAYNGLRKQVIAAAGERTAHLTQLAQFDAALRIATTTEALASLAREWLAQASLVVVEDVAQAPQAFELVGDGDGPAIVRRPAYVDAISGRTISMGIAEPAVTDERESSPAPVAGEAPESSTMASEPRAVTADTDPGGDTAENLEGGA